jgi:Cdc6-like AAA superfamily ATPase
MSGSEPGSIVRDFAALDDSSSDFAFKGRDAELKAVLKCLGLVTKRIRPIQVWIAGPPGAGKTALAWQVLSHVRQQRSAHTAYVNCWETKTLPAMIDRVLLELQIVGTQQIGARFKLEKLRRHLDGRPLLVVLDEVDRLPVKERESMLYTLGELGTVGLLCISNSRSAYFDMDERVRSRLSPFVMALGRYGNEQLVEILSERSLAALRSGTWDEGLLHRIAQLASGDARVALRTLKLSAQLAQAAGSSQIEQQHIEHGWAHVAELQRKYLLSKLTRHHDVIYGLISERGPINASEARKEYRRHCQGQGLVPVAGRTFSKYVAQLIRCGLVQQERTVSWPSTRLLRPDPRFQARGDSAS